ncbi:MAG: prephenate dehydratase [Solirubrobacterales bacterium]|nr:prephenate dehydratase [Solirubrobacterales bacterium]
MRVAYLGPPGTFSEEALRESGFTVGLASPVEQIPLDTLPMVIESVADGRAERALVPVENSIEGSVRPTLDGLIRHAGQVRIAGEYDHPIRSALIGRSELDIERIEQVISHPQPLAQCALYLASEMPRAELRVAESTSAAVREVIASELPWAAIAPAGAAEIYGGTVLRQGIEDEPGNLTRFLWLVPRTETLEGGEEIPSGASRWKTSLAFAELGADHPGALVEALQEFSSRGVNLVRIESRPLRRELGRYRFFIDLEGAESDPDVAASIAGLRAKAEWVRSLGSYPIR